MCAHVPLQFVRYRLKVSKNQKQIVQPKLLKKTNQRICFSILISSRPNTLMPLLRILFLGRIGSISYVLPIQQNIDILNRDIRVSSQDRKTSWFVFWKKFWLENLPSIFTDLQQPHIHFENLSPFSEYIKCAIM